MATSRRYRNWTSVSFATTAIDGVKSVSIDPQISDIREAADADQGPTHGTAVFSAPTITVDTINAMSLNATLAGAKGVFTATLNDSYNGVAASGGAATFTTNSLTYIMHGPISGAFNTLATRALVFHTVWVDGVTNPISVTIA
jgi:hypothetical protein